jgi:hypothetical protein
MKLSEKSALSFETKSMAQGYALVNEISAIKDLKILEASTVSPGKMFVLLNGSDVAIQAAQNKLSEGHTEILAAQSWKCLSESVLEALYGLNKTPVAEAIVVVETDSMTTAINCAQQATDIGLDVVEIRSSRGLAGKALSIVTGDRGNCEKLQSKIEKEESTLCTRIIHPVNTEFRSFFEI